MEVRDDQTIGGSVTINRPAPPVGTGNQGLTVRSANSGTEHIRIINDAAAANPALTVYAEDDGTIYIYTPDGGVLYLNGVTIDSDGNVNLTPTDIGAEPALGNPAANGYVLTSTTAGVRSWVAMSGGGGGGFDPSANNTISGEQAFTDADKPITLGTSSQQAGPIRGYTNIYGGIATLQAADVNGNEVGWLVERLRLGAGRFVFDPSDDKAEIIVTGGSAVLNFYNSGAYKSYVKFDFGDSASQTNMFVQHNGSLKRVEVGAPDSGGTGYRMLRIPN